MTAAEQYSRYVHGASLANFSHQAVQMSKLLLLDSLGCALGATQTEEGQAGIAFAQAIGGDLGSSIIGAGKKAAAPLSAYINGHLANVLDFDDTFDIYRPSHPGCQIIPAALAIAQLQHSNGAQLLTAVASAYEVTLRVGRAMGPILWRGGLPAFIGPLGPALACAKLLGLEPVDLLATIDVLTMEDAHVGLRPPVDQKADVNANMNIGGMKANYGHSAQQGVLAPYKARTGLTGIHGLLSADDNTWRRIGLPGDNFSELTHSLGSVFRILDMSFKPFPSCRWSHAAATATWLALRGRKIKPEDILRIEVRGVNRLERYKCETMYDAQFSLPCTLALLIAGDVPGPRWYNTQGYKAREITSLMQRIELSHDPEAQALEINEVRMTAGVAIELHNGELLRGHCEHMKGAPSNPMSLDDLVRKFHVNTQHLPPSRRDYLVETLLNLEKITDLSDLCKTLEIRV